MSALFERHGATTLAVQPTAPTHYRAPSVIEIGEMSVDDVLRHLVRCRSEASVVQRRVVAAELAAGDTGKIKAALGFYTEAAENLTAALEAFGVLALIDACREMTSIRLDSDTMTDAELDAASDHIDDLIHEIREILAEMFIDDEVVR